MTQALTDAGRVYSQFDAAFASISIYAVTLDGSYVARVCAKRAASGLRTTVFVHWIGSPMVKGVANGGGYDKEGAAVASAADRVIVGYETKSAHADFFVAIREDDGRNWHDRARAAGFTVVQVA